MGCFVIVAAILFIIRFNRQNDNYKPKTHSFANALYLKTSEEINEDDPNAMGSTVKICGADPLWFFFRLLHVCSMSLNINKVDQSSGLLTVLSLWCL